MPKRFSASQSALIYHPGGVVLSAAVLANFFCLWSTWAWPAPVELAGGGGRRAGATQGEAFSRQPPGQPDWQPEISPGLMPVITPVHPVINATHGMPASAFNATLAELRLAAGLFLAVSPAGGSTLQPRQHLEADEPVSEPEPEPEVQTVASPKGWPMIGGRKVGGAADKGKAAAARVPAAAAGGAGGGGKWAQQLSSLGAPETPEDCELDRLCPHWGLITTDCQVGTQPTPSAWVAHRSRSNRSYSLTPTGSDVLSRADSSGSSGTSSRCCRFLPVSCPFLAPRFDDQNPLGKQTSATCS